MFTLNSLVENVCSEGCAVGVHYTFELLSRQRNVFDI